MADNNTNDQQTSGIELFGFGIQAAIVVACILATVSAWTQSLLSVPFVIIVAWLAHIQFRNIRSLQADTKQSEEGQKT